jgi:hypothetical protein
VKWKGIQYPRKFGHLYLATWEQDLSEERGRDLSAGVRLCVCPTTPDWFAWPHPCYSGWNRLVTGSPGGVGLGEESRWNKLLCTWNAVAHDPRV